LPFGPRIPGSCPTLVGSRALVFLHLEPVLLNGGGLAGSSLALDLNPLGLVGLQFVRKVGLLGRLGRLGSRELVDVGFGVTGLDGLRLVGTELAEVQVLDGVRWAELDSIDQSQDIYNAEGKWKE
jgi:hypothetical protein